MLRIKRIRKGSDVTEDEANDIKEYAEDHYEHFGFWPHDVEVGEGSRCRILPYDDYQLILQNMK